MAESAVEMGMGSFMSLRKTALMLLQCLMLRLKCSLRIIRTLITGKNMVFRT